MSWREKLLWIDGTAGAVAGAALLLAGGWLAEPYRLPRELLTFIGAANLAYGTYSLTLASRAARPRALLVLLVVANLTWALLCLRWAVAFRGSASALGLVQLTGEALFVGGLSCLEWRWRHLLSTPPDRPAPA